MLYYLQPETYLTKENVTGINFLLIFSFKRCIYGRIPLPRTAQSRITADTSLSNCIRLAQRIYSTFCIESFCHLLRLNLFLNVYYRFPIKYGTRTTAYILYKAFQRSWVFCKWGFSEIIKSKQ